MNRADAAPVADQDEPAWSRALAVVLLGAVVVTFVASGWSRFTAPFGDNHDGSNAGVWVDAGRAIIEQGPIASRLGSRLVTGGVYAHHPPLIAWVTAVADWVGGESPFGDRMPVILSSLACLVLLIFMLRDLHQHWIAIAGGLGIALGTPMFFVYGPMLDTLPLSLPFGVALMIVWHRRVVGRPAPAWLLATVAALCVLTSWEAALLVGIACLASLILGRRDNAVVRNLAPVFIGFAVGLVIVGAWLLWASGSFGPMIDQLRFRSGTGSVHVGFVESLRRQWRNLGYGLGFGRWLLLPAVIAGIWNPRTRVVMAVLVTTTVLYPLILREATVHDFWDIWFVIPLAVGLTALIDAVIRIRPSDAARISVAVAVSLLVVLSLFETAARNPSQANLFEIGLGAAHALDHVKTDGRDVYVVLPRGYNTNWIALRTGSHVKRISSSAGFVVATLKHPDAVILVDCDNVGADYVARCRRLSTDPDAPFGGAYAATTVQSFVDRVLTPATSG